jgi:hypothetical protein
MIRFRLVVSLTLIVLQSSESTNAATYRAELIAPASGALDARDIMGGTSIGTGNTGAQMWGAADEVIDLHPVGYDFSEGYGLGKNTQVGVGGLSNRRHALLWRGSADSVIDLHSSQFLRTAAFDTNGEQQVGNGQVPVPGTFSQTHALLWSGTAQSVVDLNPAGFFYSVAGAISSTHQFGYGENPSIREYHALMWTGSPESAVDLNPSGFIDSLITGASESSQVGSGTGPITNEHTHALLWVGVSAEVVDLHPAGFNSSGASGVSNLYQVGAVSGGKTPNSHAAVWQGSSGSFIDLHDFLSRMPLNFVDSYASDVDDSGVVVGRGETPDGRSYALRWIPVPEPTLPPLLLTAAISVFVRDRKWKRSMVAAFAAASTSRSGMCTHPPLRLVAMRPSGR